MKSSYYSPVCKVLEITPFNIVCGSYSGREPVIPFTPIDDINEE